MKDYLEQRFPGKEIKVWDTLYKKTSTGAVSEWTIGVAGNVIVTFFGQVDGKLQSVEETVAGKNIGRKNERSPEQQALAEAESAWQKRAKTNAHVDVEVAKVETEKASKEGGYLPMLAHAWEDHKDKITFPCFVQPKLDGARCIAIKSNAEGVKLYSRTGKETNTVPHINFELMQIMRDGEIWDGELYEHDADFNDSVGSLRATVNTNSNATAKIKYWVYDCPRIEELKEEAGFAARYQRLERRIQTLSNVRSRPMDVVLVPTHEVFNADAIPALHKQYTADAYEGVMVRQKNMKYTQKRTNTLLKYKTFKDEEFICIGYEEGKASKAGMVGAFILKIENEAYPNRNSFKAGLIGTEVYSKDLFEHPEKFMNKPITIQYFSKSKYGIPRFPKAKAVRDYE